MISVPFRNTLRENDTVQHAVTKRRGIVATGVRESSTTVAVTWDGCSAIVRIPVNDLRFVIPETKQAEDVPPFDGELANAPQRAARQAPALIEEAQDLDELFLLEGKRDDILGEIKAIDARRAHLVERGNRIARAIEALKPSR